MTEQAEKASIHDVQSLDPRTWPGPPSFLAGLLVGVLGVGIFFILKLATVEQSVSESRVSIEQFKATLDDFRLELKASDDKLEAKEAQDYTGLLQQLRNTKAGPVIHINASAPAKR